MPSSSEFWYPGETNDPNGTKNHPTNCSESSENIANIVLPTYILYSTIAL